MSTPEQKLVLVSQNIPVYTLRPKLDTTYGAAWVSNYPGQLMLAQIESESSIPDNLLWNLLFVPHFNGFVMINRATNYVPFFGGMSAPVGLSEPEDITSSDGWSLSAINTYDGYIGVKSTVMKDYALQLPGGVISTTSPICSGLWNASQDSLLWTFKPVTNS